MTRNGLVPKRIVRVDGVTTTVYVKPQGGVAERASVGRLKPPAPPKESVATDWMTIQEFLNDNEDLYEAVYTSNGAEGNCEEVSQRYADFLSDIGESAELIDAIHPDFGPHTVLVSDGQIVDLTYRQFEEDADVPRVLSVDEFENEGWRIIA